jgi:type I restriction enzyme S subunit
MKAWQGSYGISKFDGIVSPAYFVFELNYVIPEFFHQAIRSKAYVPFFCQASDGVRVGQWDLSQTRMKEIPFAIPLPDEQRKIVAFLLSMLKKLDDLIKAYRRLVGISKSVAERKNSLLYEYRTRLISDVVTGKVDVRDISVEPVEEIEEFEDEIEETAESEEPIDADE